MNLFTGDAADELFGGDAPPAVREMLRQAQSAPAAERGALLWAAQACAPQCLATYYLLYKCHATQRQLELAERAARAGLAEAARQAGLPVDWREVKATVDFGGTGAARFWLFTMKALAFIRLRSGDLDEARALLTRLEELAPQAQVGSDVIAQLLSVASEASR